MPRLLPIRARAGFAARAAGLAVVAFAAAGVPGGAAAQGFALYVAPPRIEMAVKAGETTRQVIELQHAGRQQGSFRIFTNDWSLKPDSSVQFSDALAKDSCRPWVALERRELRIEPNGRYRFRFEVTPPPGTPPMECRFAILFEGLDTTQVNQGAFTFPVAGRIAVIVYAQVGGASPRLAIGKASVRTANGAKQPVIEVTNSGNATGRLEGYLSARDAAGAEFEMSPVSFPVLPGATQAIALQPVVEEGAKAPVIQYPLTVKGSLEWGKNREKVELRFAP